MSNVDILYVAFNRREFTEITFGCLLDNTNWDRVNRLVVVDDGSTDGTAEYLNDEIDACPADRRRFIHLGLGHPVHAMNAYLDADPADWFVKVDNDIAMPPGWLDALLGASGRNQHFDLIGVEAGMTAVAGRDGDDFDGEHGVEPCTHIGGIGLMRTALFTEGHRPTANGSHFGFTEFQHRRDPARGWLTPDLPAPLLDRLPMDPFRSLSRTYRRQGWQRPWPKYDATWMAWSYDWLLDRLKED